MNPLVKAIDEARAYVRARFPEDTMTEAEVAEFSEIAGRVYTLAHQRGLVHVLPQVAELRPEVESNAPPLPPVQFVSKLNLPGDWDWSRFDDRAAIGYVDKDGTSHLDLPKAERQRIFVFFASPRWEHDVEILRGLAEQAVPPPRGEHEPVSYTHLTLPTN